MWMCKELRNTFVKIAGGLQVRRDAGAKETIGIAGLIVRQFASLVAGSVAGWRNGSL